MTSIKEKQNETQILKKQYAARHCYNCAELFGVLSWICCIVIAIVPFIFENDTTNSSAYLIALLTVFEFSFDNICQWYIKIGAALRIYIDNYLFNFGEQEYYGEMSLNVLDYITNIVIHLHKKTYKKQIENSETDKTRGVKDWYVFDESLTPYDAIKSCQLSNINYDSVITKIHCILTISLIIGFIAAIFKADNHGLLLCAFLSIVIKIVNYIIDINRYNKCKKHIEHILSQIEVVEYNVEIAKKLQEAINHRRQLNVVPFSFIYYGYLNLKEKICSDIN
ncbi:MAG: hypothetical protein IKJ27_09980 [Clostridia bacterium]|nr:hypothetical protein [Clostridia bacterium]